VSHKQKKMPARTAVVEVHGIVIVSNSNRNMVEKTLPPLVIIEEYYHFD
jgi:hypothetical protein